MTAVPDVNLHAGATEAVEHRDLAQVAARDGVTHLREHESERAHSGTAYPDDVVPAGARQVKRYYRAAVSHGPRPR
ncbi:unannotated protein [freshwater metagenome]|uniref:Unannotated protein n=1 Tax=freshwater metagenome TaxID=449393 RepID=A0A6J7DK43_9ZZZZ